MHPRPVERDIDRLGAEADDGGARSLVVIRRERKDANAPRDHFGYQRAAEVRQRIGDAGDDGDGAGKVVRR